MDSYDHNNLYGPFKNPDDIGKFWYLVTEKELEEYIKISEDGLKEAKEFKVKSDVKIYEQDIKNTKIELDNLHKFVENYQRCLERYKYDKNILKQVQKDWEDYNFSLYMDWNRISIYMLDPSQFKGEAIISNKEAAKMERIKREEIEKRFDDKLETSGK